MLTEAELHVIDLLAEATNAFAALPEHHPTEMREWVADVHHLQERVMCRSAIRAHPDRFTAMAVEETR